MSQNEIRSIETPVLVEASLAAQPIEVRQGGQARIILADETQQLDVQQAVVQVLPGPDGGEVQLDTPAAQVLEVLLPGPRGPAGEDGALVGRFPYGELEDVDSTPVEGSLPVFTSGRWVAGPDHTLTSIVDGGNF